MEKEIQNKEISLYEIIGTNDENHCICRNCKSIWGNKDTGLCNCCEYEGY